MENSGTMEFACETIPTAQQLLQLDNLGDDHFRARHNLDNLMRATFGGQALGQALAAAQMTAPDWPANSLSGHFLSAGRIDLPIDFSVERTRDGRRFASRRVLASQAGKPIFDLLCSFHALEPGVNHQFTHQLTENFDAPAPESLPSLQAFAMANADRLPKHTAAIFARPFPVELRLLDYGQFFAPSTEASRDFWFRIPSATAIERPMDHQALLAMMSDYWLPGAITIPHAAKGAGAVTSLNHTLWFHQPVHTDQWLLYRTDSHWAGHTRGLARGLIFNRDGALIASVMQEALVQTQAGR